MLACASVMGVTGANIVSSLCALIGAAGANIVSSLSVLISLQARASVIGVALLAHIVQK